MSQAKARAKKAAASKGAAASRADKSAGRVIDLDQARVARAEKRGDVDPPVVRFEGKELELPIEAPYEFAALLEQGVFGPALSVVFGEEKAAEIVKLLSVDDLEAFAEGLYDVYGLDEEK